MKTVRIVLVDDHLMLRQGIRKLLEEHTEFEIVGEASDGREALSIISERKPDIAILDIAMPRLNGLEAARQIQSHHPSVRVLILSMYENEEYVKQALIAGVSGYILKDSAVEELVWGIRAITQGHHFLSPPICTKVVREYIKDFGGKAKKMALDNLTSREREVLQLVAEGKSTKAVASLLFISPKTVEAHRSNIAKKLKTKSYAELRDYAIKKGFLITEHLDGSPKKMP
jgi:DNA-binding NarL/FixJ family response regulator